MYKLLEKISFQEEVMKQLLRNLTENYHIYELFGPSCLDLLLSKLFSLWQEHPKLLLGIDEGTK